MHLLTVDTFGKPRVSTTRLTRGDWQIIAAAAARVLPDFEFAIAASPAGTKLCRQISKYRNRKSTTILVVDNVWKGDNSMFAFAEAYLKRNPRYKDWTGFVAFAMDNDGHRQPRVKCFMQVMT